MMSHIQKEHYHILVFFCITVSVIALRVTNATMSDWPGPVEHSGTVGISNNQLWLLKVLFS